MFRNTHMHTYTHSQQGHEFKREQEEEHGKDWKEEREGRMMYLHYNVNKIEFKNVSEN